MPPAKSNYKPGPLTGTKPVGKAGGHRVTGDDLVRIATEVEELAAPIREYDALEQELLRGFAPGNEARFDYVTRRLAQLEPLKKKNAPLLDAKRSEAGDAPQNIRQRAVSLRLQLNRRVDESGELRAPGTVSETLRKIKEEEEYFAAALATGDPKTQKAIQDLFDQAKRITVSIATDPEKYLTNHEIRQLVRKQEGLGLKERGQGICFKMLDQYQMMSPKEKAQIAGVPNVISCTAEGVRAWEARNAEFAAEKAREAFEASQKIEKARQEMQDLRLTCYPMPDWVRGRIEAHPQKAVGLQLGMRAPLPVPFTRDEVLQSVRDIVRYGSKLSAETGGRCAPVDPTSVHIAKYVAGVLANWFSSWGWVKVQLSDGGRWGEVHLADRIDKLHNDPFTFGFSATKASYVVPLELGPSFTTTFETEQRLAAAPSYLRLFGRPMFGPAAALAQELEAAGQLTPEAIARIEEMIRSGVTWEQVLQRAGAYPSGETMTQERPVTLVRPRL